MDNINSYIDTILEHEGGYVNHPADKGGATNYGITQATLSRYLGRDVSEEEVKRLDINLAREIYQNSYYSKPGIDRLPQAIQLFILDCAVNHGPRRAIRFVQSVCNQAGYQPQLGEDGVIGAKTITAAEWAQQAMGPIFLKALIEERRMFYYRIVQNNPSQQVFLAGWLNRANKFEQEVA